MESSETSIVQQISRLVQAPTLNVPAVSFKRPYTMPWVDLGQPIKPIKPKEPTGHPCPAAPFSRVGCQIMLSLLSSFSLQPSGTALCHSFASPHGLCLAPLFTRLICVSFRLDYSLYWSIAFAQLHLHTNLYHRSGSSFLPQDLLVTFKLSPSDSLVSSSNSLILLSFPL